MQNKFQDKFDHVLKPMSTHRKIQRYYSYICNVRCKTLKEIIVVLHMIKVLAEHFEGHFQCLGRDTEKLVIFLVPTKEMKTTIGNIETKVYQQHKVYGKDHYQVLLTTIPKDFTIVNATTVNDSLLVLKSVDCKRKKRKRV